MYPPGAVTGLALLFLSFLLKNGLAFAMLQEDPSVMSSRFLWHGESLWLGQAQGRKHVLPGVWLCRGGLEGVVGTVGAPRRLQPHVPSLRHLQKMFSD